jgi:hypothetical protein
MAECTACRACPVTRDRMPSACDWVSRLNLIDKNRTGRRGFKQCPCYESHHVHPTHHSTIFQPSTDMLYTSWLGVTSAQSPINGREGIGGDSVAICCKVHVTEKTCRLVRIHT